MATRYVVEDSRIAKSTISTVISYINFIVFCLFCRNLLDACGSKEDQIDMFCSLLKKEDVLKIIHAPQSKYILEAVTKDVVSKFSNLLTSFDVQNICDDVGISRHGYHAIHQLLKDGLQKQGIIENLFPVPKKVKLAKKVSDVDVFSRLGPYYFVEDTMVILGLQKKGGAKKQRLGKKSGPCSKSAPANSLLLKRKVLITLNS